ncbi:MAG TPA: amino acid ABC transporter permease [Castellaniella sp.]|uniref:amino acid ABC transporter permease n=1 Tax=Castellaniella sp. TaxID=1955812 RepID=UPI002F10730C
MNGFDWSIIVRNWQYLGQGMLLSLMLVVVASAGGIALGFGLALMRLSRSRVLAGFATSYVTVMRSVPLILVLFWFYFLVPLVIGHPISALGSALVAFVLFEAAFYCEIVRAGILSVRRGQTEAALATGMQPSQALWLVVIPQAIRAMVPLVINQIVIVFQDTSLVYVVALTDFMTAASVVAQRDNRPIEVYTFVAVVYLVICFVLSRSVAFYKARGSK